MIVTASDNIASINSALSDYQRLSGLTVKDILEKQGGKLERAVYIDVWATRPKKGAIRAEILARLAQHRGIKVRQSAMDFVAAKRARPTAAGRLRSFSLNARQMEIAREISIRESGRGVLGISARYPATLSAEVTLTSLSRYGTILSDASVKLHGEGGMAQIAWRGFSEQGQRALQGIQAPRAASAIRGAIDKTAADIRVYNTRKQKELITASVKKFIKGGGLNGS